MKHLLTLVAVLAMTTFSLGCESDDDAAGGASCDAYVVCCSEKMIENDPTEAMTFAQADAACEQGVAGATEEACAAMLAAEGCN